MEEKLKLADVNSFLVCRLCQGYLIDAVSLSECGHSYCRSCLLGYHRYDTRCPQCPIGQGRGGISKGAVRLDHDLQRIVYKMVPNLFHSELQRRLEFYETNSNHSAKKKKDSRKRRGSSARKSSQRRDRIDRVFDRHLFRMASLICSHDDTVCVSLEYIEPENALPETQLLQENKTEPSTSQDATSKKGNEDQMVDENHGTKCVEGKPFKRYFRCPAGTKIGHFIKIMEKKFDVKGGGYSIGIMCGNKPLLDEETLLDVALMFNWHRTKPLRLKFTLVQWKTEKKECSDEVIEQMPSLTREIEPIQSPGVLLPREPTPDPLKNFEEACQKATPTVRFDKSGNSVVTTHAKSSKRAKSPKEIAPKPQRVPTTTTAVDCTPETVPSVPVATTTAVSTSVVLPATTVAAPTIFVPPTSAVPFPLLSATQFTVPIRPPPQSSQPPTNFSDITTFVPPVATAESLPTFTDQPRRKKRKASSPSKKTKASCDTAVNLIPPIAGAEIPPTESTLVDQEKPKQLDSPKLVIDDNCSDHKGGLLTLSTATPSTSTELAQPVLPSITAAPSAPFVPCVPVSGHPPMLPGSRLAYASTPSSPSMSIAVPLLARSMVPPPPRKMALPPKQLIPQPSASSLGNGNNGNVSANVATPGGPGALTPIFPGSLSNFNGGGMLILIDNRRFPHPQMPPQPGLPSTTTAIIRSTNNTN